MSEGNSTVFNKLADARLGKDLKYISEVWSLVQGFSLPPKFYDGLVISNGAVGLVDRIFREEKCVLYMNNDGTGLFFPVIGEEASDALYKLSTSATALAFLKNNSDLSSNEFDFEYKILPSDFAKIIECAKQHHERLKSANDHPQAIDKPSVADVKGHAATALSDSVDKPLDPRVRTSLLRIIRALDAMNKLPEKGVPASIVAQLELLGFNSPNDETIRRYITEARILELDFQPSEPQVPKARNESKSQRKSQ